MNTMATQNTSEKFVFFRPEGDLIDNVHLDWLGNYTPSAMAEAFKDAADRVVISIRADVRHPDAFVYPVAYLYRHYLELQLKNVIHQAANLLGKRLGKRELFGHDLQRLWRRARSLILEVWPGGEATHLAPIDQAVQEFAELDFDGQCFRYFENRDNQRNLQNSPRILSLDNLMDRMDEAFEILSGCELGIGHYAREGNG
jgi:hypothetical protein